MSLWGRSLDTGEGGIFQKIAATIKGGKFPLARLRGSNGEPFDKVLGRFSHHFRQRPILQLGDFFQSLVQGIGELNLGSYHDVFLTPPPN